MCIALRYSLLSDRVTIKGAATSYTYYGGTNLPGEFVKVSGNNYYSYSSKRNCETSKGTSIKGNTISASHKKFLCTSGSKTYTYTVKYKNTTEKIWTLGTASAKSIRNDSGYIDGEWAYIDKTTVKPGETVTLTLKIKSNFPWSVGTQEIQGTYSFMFLNVRRYVYFKFKYYN